MGLVMTTNAPRWFSGLWIQEKLKEHENHTLQNIKKQTNNFTKTQLFKLNPTDNSNSSNKLKRSTRAWLKLNQPPTAPIKTYLWKQAEGQRTVDEVDRKASGLEDL